MEFLRFGSSIPGSYWGCCAMDIIQNFAFDPDAKASIQVVSGDSGNPLTNDKGFIFCGPTYHDIFKQRLRIGTFSNRDMPNHGFLAVLTGSQVASTTGKKWLKILKENGFEFLRCVDNSVYSGKNVITEPGKGSVSQHPNYLFGLFRNIGQGMVDDPFKAPEEWDKLPDPYNGDMSNENMQKVQLEMWHGLGPVTFLSEEDVLSAGSEVTLAGLRSEFKQQTKKQRDELIKRKQGPTKPQGEVSDPFAPKSTSVDDTVTEPIDDYDDDEDIDGFDEPCTCSMCI